MKPEEFLKQWSHEIVVIGERVLKNYPYLNKADRVYVTAIVAKYKRSIN